MLVVAVVIVYLKCLKIVLRCAKVAVVVVVGLLLGWVFGRLQNPSTPATHPLISHPLHLPPSSNSSTLTFTHPHIHPSSPFFTTLPLPPPPHRTPSGTKSVRRFSSFATRPSEHSSRRKCPSCLSGGWEREGGKEAEERGREEGRERGERKRKGEREEKREWRKRKEERGREGEKEDGRRKERDQRHLYFKMFF